MTVTDDANTARAPAPDLDGLRVLFLPKNSRTSFFETVLGAAVADRGWRVHAVCPDRESDYWRGIVGDAGATVAVPDFSVPADWEDDPAVVRELDAYVAACERASGISAGRIILAGERDLGRGFARTAYHWFENEIASKVLADNLAPFPILRRYFAFARDTLAEARPDLVLAGEWANPLCFTFRLAARHLGIPCVVNRPSKLWSGRCFWSAGQLMYNDAARTLAGQLRAGNGAVSDRSRERIAAFRAQPETLGYVRDNWTREAQRGWWRYHRELAGLFRASLRHRLGKGTGARPKPVGKIARDHYRKPWLRRRQARFFSRMSAQQLEKTPYLFLSLHKDPEQALNYQAPFWTSQYNTVSLVTTVLPAGVSLFAREHRLNTGRRPTRYYVDMSRLPGLTLIDAFDDQFKYIRNADLIVTDNGSTGWEGLMLGKRVITLADSFYDGAGLARRVRDPERLAETVIEALDAPEVADPDAHDRALGCMLDAEWDTTAAIDAQNAGPVLDLLGRMLVEHNFAKQAT